MFASTLLSNHVRCDNHDSCEFWASIGECAKNPNYMLDNCADACAAVDQTVANNIPESIFDIVEEDLFGREFRLDSLKGKVIYIVNVASQCGYTQSNYEEMREIRKDFHRKDLEMIIQPCNSFGAQEPGDPRQIKQFAFHLGYNGMILSKGEVNGPETRPLFKFLKSKTGKNNISWYV